MIKYLKEKFETIVEKMQRYQTAGTPGTVLLGPMNGSQNISESDQKVFRSGVGMLLYLVKHSRSGKAHAFRELSKSMDGATLAGMKELKRVVKYVIDA